MVRKLDLGRIEHVKHDQIVAEEAVRLQGLEQILRVFVQVGDQRDDAAALEVLGDLA